jgi:short-subunit dehydrogenase
MMAINLLSPARLFRTVLPGMLARKRGVIVNVTSMAAIVTLPGWIYQSASKIGSATFSEGLREELAVYPGMTDTPMTQAGLDAYGRKGLANLLPLGNANEMATRLVHAVARRRARFFYPRFYALARLFPHISAWLSARFAPRLPA